MNIIGPLNRLPVTEELEPLNQPRKWDEMTVIQKRERILDLYEAVREKVNGKIKKSSKVICAEMREEEYERNLYLAQRRGPWYYQLLRSRNATVVAFVIGFILFTMVAVLVIVFRTL